MALSVLNCFSWRFNKCSRVPFLLIPCYSVLVESYVSGHYSPKAPFTFNFILGSAINFELFIYFQEPLNFPSSELKKFFKVGDHVKVIHGKYEGDTGLILRVLGKTAILFSDLTMHEVRLEEPIRRQ